jgi:hypothetical protein
MKKVSFLFFFLFLGLAYTSFSQTIPKDFFAGKWEISVTGTPNGDAKFITNLVRKDGKLTGEMADPVDTTKPKTPITKVEEKGNNMVIYFESAEAGELSIDLAKVDDDNLKGTVYNFETTAKRLK